MVTLRAYLAAAEQEREAEANAKVIEGEAMPSLPAPTAVNAKSS